MQYEYILMVIPIIIIVAFLVVIAKRMTDGERPDISGAVLGTIIIAVGLLIMVPIISSVDPQFEYDDEDKTFTLYKNVTGTDFSWGSAANAESLIIEDTVTTISAGAFASFTDLKYISIPDSLETIGEGAFPTLKDYMDQTITAPEAGEYVGTGNGTLFFMDGSIFTYSTNNKTITGLTTEAATAVNLVIPPEKNGTTITSLGSGAFYDVTSVATVVFHPDSELTSFDYQSLRNTSIVTLDPPNTVTLVGSNSLNGCTSLVSFDPPSSLTNIGYRAFYGCTSLASFDFSSSLTTIGAGAFQGCTGVTSVTFGSEFAPTLDSSCFSSWTFYDSDGTTVIDKTVAANLAGFTFQGTASALVKVLPDRSVLTTEQTLKVQELTKAAAKASKLEESELQISEKAELAEA